MNSDVPRAWIERLAGRPEEEQRAFLAKCTPADLLALDAMFETWWANGQRPPSGDGWRVWLMMAGRGYGKTRAGAEWIHKLALTGKRRIALVGATIDEARSVMVEGVSGLISVARRRRARASERLPTRALRWSSPGAKVWAVPPMARCKRSPSGGRSRPMRCQRC